MPLPRVSSCIRLLHGPLGTDFTSRTYEQEAPVSLHSSWRKTQPSWRAVDTSRLLVGFCRQRYKLIDCTSFEKNISLSFDGLKVRFEIECARAKIDKKYSKVDNQVESNFCKRVSEDFVGYDDLTTSVIESVGMMQDGIFGLASVDSSSEQCVFLIPELTRFPMALDNASITNIYLTSEHLLKQLSPPAEFDSRPSCLSSTVMLAILARLCLKKLVIGLDSGELLGKIWLATMKHQPTRHGSSYKHSWIVSWTLPRIRLPTWIRHW